MRPKKDKVLEMIASIDAIIADSRDVEKRYGALLEQVHPKWVRSARNLLHYRVMRTHDLRSLQKRLGHLGLSRLAKAQSHVLASLYADRAILKALAADKKIKGKRPDFSVKEAGKLLSSHTKALLGYRSKGRRTRIMVTLPSEAAGDPRLVHDLVAAGMNCARINCAHDDADAWGRMVEHVRAAGRKLQRNCKVAMDLAGPKIRTGVLAPGPRVMKIRPERDERGHVLNPARLWLAPAPHPVEAGAHLPVADPLLAGVEPGALLYFRELRGKQRRFRVVGCEEGGCWVHAYKTSYIETDTPFFLDPEGSAEPVLRADLPPIEQPIILHPGDRLRIHRAPEPGEPARYDKEGALLQEPHISCTAPEVFGRACAGEPILFDDGKIEGVIRSASPDELVVEITYARQSGGKLRADKGINFPGSDLGIRGLTEKDRQDLAFVAEHADVVNMSFVNSAEDVEDLLAEIDRLGAADRLGIILKIETQSGFDRLTTILLAAMRIYPVGVMIARGDLAIECGWEQMARIQQEILALCEAAHVPDIWATQVLENLAKKGIPSRAELTDAAMAQRAECVMLNKGPQIVRAIRMLDRILKDMEPYHERNAPLLPAMQKADPPSGV